MQLLPIKKDDNGCYLFECPGCGCLHAFDSRWKFNGDLQNPTFTPSYKATYPNGNVCHLHVRNGKVEFCGDCTNHDLGGQTVDMVKRW